MRRLKARWFWLVVFGIGIGLTFFESEQVRYLACGLAGAAAVGMSYERYVFEVTRQIHQDLLSATEALRTAKTSAEFNWPEKDRGGRS